MQIITLSVIVPFLNEKENLVVLHKQLYNVLKRMPIVSELIYVDDGSSDGSSNILKDSVKSYKEDRIRVKIIELKRNYGQTAAIVAGFDNSSGKFISFLDADLQNDPQDLPKFLEEMKKGYDAVFGWRKDRKDTSLRSYLSKVANRLINVIFAYPYHDVGCSTRMVRREYVDNLELYGELHRIMPVLIYLRGAKVNEIVVKHRGRVSGKSKYGFERILKTIIDIITVKFLSSYGTRPAYIFGTFGIVCIITGAVALIGSIYKKIFLGIFIHRDPLFLIAIFFDIIGIQFILMGLLAELQVRTYFGSQKKDIYEVRRKDIY